MCTAVQLHAKCRPRSPPARNRNIIAMSGDIRFRWWWDRRRCWQACRPPPTWTGCSSPPSTSDIRDFSVNNPILWFESAMVACSARGSRGRDCSSRQPCPAPTAGRSAPGQIMFQRDRIVDVVGHHVVSEGVVAVASVLLAQICRI